MNVLSETFRRPQHGGTTTPFTRRLRESARAAPVLAALFALLLGLGAGQARAQGILDTSFVPPEHWAAWDPGVDALAIQPDGKVVVSAGNTVVRLSADGSLDASFARVSLDGSASRVLLLPDGKVLIAGAFSTVNDQAAPALVRLGADGRLDASFVAAPTSGSILGLALQPDGKLLIAGRFDSVGGAAATSCVARLQANGSVDATFASPISASFNCGIAVVALRADGKILFGGAFPFPTADDPISTLVRLNPDGSFDADLSASAGLADNVKVLHPLPDGRLLAGGLDGSVERVVRLNADDSRDTGFDVSVTNNGGRGMIFNVLAQPNGKVVIAGLFTHVNGQLRKYLGRVDADGSVDAAFNTGGAGINTYYVSSLAAQLDGRLLVGGTFTLVDNAARAGLARLLVPDAAVERLGFGATPASLSWQRSGSGPELDQVRFDSSIDGQTWTALGPAQWNAGSWELTPASPLPAQGSLWLRASGAATTGAGHSQGTFSGSQLASTRQIRATVTPSAGSGGGIAPATPQFVVTGQPASFTLVPDSGQQVLGVGGTCRGRLNGNTYTTEPIDADCTVVASFTSSGNIVVTPSAGSGGAIAPASPQAFAAGAQASFTLTPQTGHAIAEVGGSCGGSLAGTVFTTLPLSANCSVDASFAITRVTVSATASGGHGSIAPAQQTLNYGEAATLSVVAEPGYNAFVSGCGGALSGTLYTTAPLTGDCAVQASFRPFSAEQTSVQLKLALEGSNEDVCAVGTPSLAVRRGESRRINLCVMLNNQSGRDLNQRTLMRSALRDDFNAYQPWFIAQGGVQGSVVDGGGFSSFYDLGTARASTDVTVTWVAHDASASVPTYSYDDGAAFVPLDLSAMPAAVNLGLERQHTSKGVHLPFAFNFFGIPTDVLCVSNDGALIAESEFCETTFGARTSLLIAPALRSADDGGFTGYEGGAVRTAVLGTAPNRRFAVEWRDKRIAGVDGGGVTFQALVDEGSGAITFQYVTMAVGGAADDGAGAFAGLTLGFYDAPFAYPAGAVLTGGKAIRWTPSAQPFTSVATASAHITVLAPEISTQPSAVNAHAPLGGTSTAVLTLGNAGNETLNWTSAVGAGGRGFQIAQAHAPPLVQAMPAASASAQRSAPEAAAADAPQGSAGVPAYAHAWNGMDNSRLVSLDAASPTSLAAAASSVSVLAIHAGGFVDDDFRQLYVIQSPGCGDPGCWDGLLQRLDPAVGDSSRTVLSGMGAAPAAGQNWRGMRWDSRTGTLFAVASDAVDPGPPYRSDLYRIDPVTGLAEHVARIDDLGVAGTALADIAIDNDGNLYGVEMTEDVLVAIDKTTGHLRPIGPTGLDVGYYSLQSTDFDRSTGDLYYTTWTNDSSVGQQMFTLDKNTGAATLVGTVGDGHSGLRMLSIAKAGNACVGADQVPWLSLDHGSGVVAPAQSDAVALRFDAAGLQPGVHRANVCIGSDTPYRGQVTVPVTLTVGAADAIFADGFESH
ncbi:delta-60 repeat domain-containing protein [Dokdonella sp.]|uniref:delta-60 repeat domain-containing protein n=1 Tax=Dokdonella sp. TaxID=2291710 RepID=UPI001B0CD0D7|nr:delta-60 repeat domain-containing protein [Dokdonella sp.]MBO9664221.1 hypothetical protein [Dokdonella sp.]